MTKYYADVQGNYIGGFAGVEPPDGAIEVPSAPSDARHKWANGAWVANANDLIDAAIMALESEHPITIRDYRETKVALAEDKGLPAAWCDPAQPDPSDLPEFKALAFGLRIAVIQERGARALRAQRKG